MGMMDVEPFSDPKPSFFPPSVDVRPRKVWKLEDGSELKANTQSFDKAFEKALSNQKKEEAEANIKASRQTEAIYEGIGGFIPRDILAKIEQTKNRFNFENPDKDPTYQYYPDKLETPFYKSDPTMESDIFNASFLTSKDNVPGAENTLAHNANLLYGIDTNPFLKGDEENYDIFENNPYYKDLHTQSKSPRSILQKLDPTFWDSMNSSMTLIQNTSINGVALNLDNVANPFQDTQNDIKTIDIKANFHTVIASQLWRGWNDSNVFHFINRAWEARSRIEGTMREILGKNADIIPAAKAETTAATNASEATASPEAADSPKTESVALTKVKAWWDSIGSKLDEPRVLPFGLLSSMAPAMSEMMDWGNWGDEAAQNLDKEKNVKSSGFREKMISSYLRYASDHYVLSGFKSSKPLSPADLPVDNVKTVWSNLITKGYIDAAGNVKSEFNAKDPDFSLGIGLEPGEEDTVRNRLREAVIGQFSLDVQDKTEVNGKTRHDITVTGPDGTSKSLAEVIDLINSGQDGIERIENAKKAYSYLFNLHATMTGLQDTSSPEKTGTVQYTTTAANKIQVKIADQGEWKQWSADGKWTPQKGPVSLAFDTVQDAEKFKNNIRMLLALLEPVVGTFNPNDTDGTKSPLHVLIDNTGTSTKAEYVKEGDAAYRMSVDTPLDKSFFKSDEWKEASEFLSKKSIGTISFGIFTRSQQNKILSRDHSRKVEDYDLRKEEYEIEEMKSKNREIENRNKEMEEQAIAEKRRKEENDAMEQEGIARAEKRRAEERAREEKEQEEG